MRVKVQFSLKAEKIDHTRMMMMMMTMMMNPASTSLNEGLFSVTHQILNKKLLHQSSFYFN